MAAQPKRRFRALPALLAAAAYVSLLPACGARLIPYVPDQDAMSAAEALRVVERTIEQQPGPFVPHGVDVTPVKLTITTKRTQILYFDDLWRTDLHSKRSYYIVRFWDDKRHGFRIFVSEQRDAQRFLDALHVLTEENKRLAELPEPERARRVRTVERQRKQLELEIDVSEGPPDD
jgi:hypothetical protein